MLQHMEALTAYVLSLGLATALLLVWLVHRQRTSGGFSLWLASGVAGILLGSAGSYALLCAAGFNVIKVEKAPTTTAANGATGSAPPMAHAGAMGGGGMGAGGMRGGGMGGGQGPNPKRDLTNLVRKVNLLTDDIALKLTPDQIAALLKGLAGVDQAEKFSDDEAKTMQEELLAVLSDDQKAKLEIVGLPGGGRGGGGGGGMGGGTSDPNANPFTQEANLKALKSFRDRFAIPASVDTETSEK